MFSNDFDQLTLADIEYLVENRISEGRQLEFKRDHYGRNDESKREFAADVSAMANAFGGHLLVGVGADKGTASEVCGVIERDPDGLMRNVSDSIRSSLEPPLLGCRVKWIPIDEDRGVLLIRIPRSDSAPHRVVVGNSRHFYLRDENGKHPMSVSELRRAFLFGAEVEERIRRFRTERTRILVDNEGPLAVGTPDDARLILHVIPRATFTEGLQLTFDERSTGYWPWPLGTRGGDPTHCMDGIVAYAGSGGQIGTVRAFSTLFRNGIAEAVAGIHVATKEGRTWISLKGIEKDLSSGVRSILREYRKRSIPAPFLILVTIVGVRGVSVSVGDRYDKVVFPYRADGIVIPEIVLDSLRVIDDLDSHMKPLFDLMWNAFGHRASPYFE